MRLRRPIFSTCALALIAFAFPLLTLDGDNATSERAKNLLTNAHVALVTVISQEEKWDACSTVARSSRAHCPTVISKVDYEGGQAEVFDDFADYGVPVTTRGKSSFDVVVVHGTGAATGTTFLIPLDTLKAASRDPRDTLRDRYFGYGTVAALLLFAIWSPYIRSWFTRKHGDR